jgi:MarR family transcriptional regulator, transcriptional regulator for hemolysin
LYAIVLLVQERLGKVLAIASKLARERFDRRLRTVGASFPAYMVLTHAEAYPGLSQRGLADRLGIEGPTLVRHIDRLVSDGLVRRVRDPQDRRVSRVELTAEGKEATERYTTVANQSDAEFRSLFTPEEVESLYEFLYRIQDHYAKESDAQYRAG